MNFENKLKNFFSLKYQYLPGYFFITVNIIFYFRLLILWLWNMSRIINFSLRKSFAWAISSIASTKVFPPLEKYLDVEDSSRICLPLLLLWFYQIFIKRILVLVRYNLYFSHLWIFSICCFSLTFCLALRLFCQLF